MDRVLRYIQRIKFAQKCIGSFAVFTCHNVSLVIAAEQNHPVNNRNGNNRNQNVKGLYRYRLKEYIVHKFCGSGGRILKV
jgi:hypothetical protein